MMRKAKVLVIDDDPDILDGFDTIKVCVGYKLDGREIDYLPAGERAQADVEPVYEIIDGLPPRHLPWRPHLLFLGQVLLFVPHRSCLPGHCAAG